MPKEVSKMQQVKIENSTFIKSKSRFSTLTYHTFDTPLSKGSDSALSKSPTSGNYEPRGLSCGRTLIIL